MTLTNITSQTLRRQISLSRRNFKIRTTREGWKNLTSTWARKKLGNSGYQSSTVSLTTAPICLARYSRRWRRKTKFHHLETLDLGSFISMMLKKRCSRSWLAKNSSRSQRRSSSRKFKLWTTIQTTLWRSNHRLRIGSLEKLLVPLISSGLCFAPNLVSWTWSSPSSLTWCYFWSPFFVFPL